MKALSDNLQGYSTVISSGQFTRAFKLMVMAFSSLLIESQALDFQRIWRKISTQSIFRIPSKVEFNNNNNNNNNNNHDNDDDKKENDI